MPITALFSLFGLLVLWLMVLLMWKAYRIAKLRQDLFDIRGQLFDLALARPELSFDHPAYRRLRTTLNSLIRFAHRMTFIQYATLYFSRADTATEVVSREWKACILSLPSVVADELGNIRLRMHVAVAGFIFRMPQPLLIYYMGNRRQKVAYVGQGRLESSYRNSSPHRYHMVAALRELEHQAVEERNRELAKQNDVALV